MAKKNGEGNRTRVNPITGETEQVTGPKAGRRRSREPLGSPLRTHDLRPPGSRKRAHVQREGDE